MIEMRPVNLCLLFFGSLGTLIYSLSEWIGQKKSELLLITNMLFPKRIKSRNSASETHLHE